MKVIKPYAIALKNIMLGMNLIKLPLILAPEKLLWLTQSEIFNFLSFSNMRKLPQKEVFDVFASIGANPNTHARIDISFPNKWFSYDTAYLKDLISLCLLCQFIKPRIIFEIGTLDGFTAYHFALNTEDSTVVYTLDLPPEGYARSILTTTCMDDFHIAEHSKQVHYIFANKAESKKIHCLFGDSATFDYSPYEHLVDLFFIDGAHSYDYVLSDTIKANYCTHKGSVIAWHDYGRVGVNGVSRVLHRLFKGKAYSIPGSSVAFAIIE